MAELEHYLAAFGPVAILFGAAFEGQTAVIAGGVIARQQLISPFTAMAAAALGSGILDQVLFILGRSFRHTGFVQRVAAKSAFAKALRLIERYPTGFILSFRFLYGLRAAGPVAMGVTQVSTLLFATLNALGAVIWAGVFVGLGFVFGPAVMSVLGAFMAHMAPFAIGAGVVVVAGGLIFWRWRVWVTSQGREAPKSAELPAADVGH
jgi:membrane protein DedA with SNARE-associated domain